MWASILLFAILLPILIFSLVVATIAFGIVLLRRKSGSEPIPFTGIIYAYAALMMLVGLFLMVSGFAFILKAAVGSGISHDFVYKVEVVSRFSSSSDSPAGDDVVYGIVLLLVGAVMLFPHTLGVLMLRRRGVAGSAPVLRGFNLIGLATSTIGFLASGASALGSVLERTTDADAVGWTEHHPGEPLVFALFLAPLVCWFTYQLWIDVTRDVPKLASAPGDYSEATIASAST